MYHPVPPLLSRCLSPAFRVSFNIIFPSLNPAPHTKVLVPCADVKLYHPSPHTTQVLVSCISGCTCNATHVNGLVKEVRNSQTDAHVLPVTESRDCVIRIVLMLVRPRVCGGEGEGNLGWSMHEDGSVCEGGNA